MKNILKSVLFTLIVLTPSAGFAMYIPSVEEELELKMSHDAEKAAIESEKWHDRDCLCMDDDNASAERITLNTNNKPCHTFHTKCIKQWFATKNVKPVCPCCQHNISDLQWLVLVPRKENDLHMASQKGQLERVRLLIACGIGVNTPDRKGNTALDYAWARRDTSNNYKKIIGLLIKNGAMHTFSQRLFLYKDMGAALLGTTLQAAMMISLAHKFIN